MHRSVSAAVTDAVERSAADCRADAADQVEEPVFRVRAEEWIDDSEPDKGFMLSGLCRLRSDPQTAPRRKPGRARNTQKPPTSDVSPHRPSHENPSGEAEVPYAVPERLERRLSHGESR